MRRILIIGAAILSLLSPAKAADSTVTALTAAGALAGTELFYCVQTAADRKCTPAQIQAYLTAATNTFSAVQTFNANDLKLAGVTGSTQCLHADTTGVVTGTGSDCGAGGGTVGLLPYVSGSYYAPFGGATTTASQLYVNGTTYCRVAYFKNLGTVDSLGAAVIIISSGGNFQLAVYAISATTQLPTGSPLMTTGSISTTSLGTPTGTVNSGTPFQIGSGSNNLTPYGFCIMVDATAGGVAGFTATANGTTGMASDVGSTTAALAMGGQQGFGSVQLSGQTFGTWPNLTAAGFTRNSFGGIIPVFHLSSVP